MAGCNMCLSVRLKCFRKLCFHKKNRKTFDAHIKFSSSSQTILQIPEFFGPWLSFISWIKDWVYPEFTSVTMIFQLIFISQTSQSTTLVNNKIQNMLIHFKINENSSSFEHKPKYIWVHISLFLTEYSQGWYFCRIKSKKNRLVVKIGKKWLKPALIGKNSNSYLHGLPWKRNY